MRNSGLLGMGESKNGLLVVVIRLGVRINGKVQNISN